MTAPGKAVRKAPRKAPRRHPKSRPEIGIALAGGGPLGAVYEIGALRALDEALDGLDINALDSYVGVSAGAFVAACLANGITSTQLVRMLFRNEPGEIPFTPDTFFTPAYREIGRRALMLPRLATGSVWKALRRPGAQGLGAGMAHLARALPVGYFDNEPIRRYLSALLENNGRTDDFRALSRRLTIVAADLESGEPVLFGTDGWDHIPISRAVQASTAVPGLYLPVEIDGRPCVDGALLKTMHASVPLGHGAALLLCINPIVPVNTRSAVEAGAMRPGELVERGMPAVLSQTVRTVLRSRMDAGLTSYAHRYPRADVVVFEPERDEYGMFFANLFSLSSREAICDLAYEATRRDLSRRRDELAPLLARHGVRLREDVLDDESRTLWKSVDLRARREDSGGSAVRRLGRTVTRVERAVLRRGRRGAA
ncbi:MAG TPA: patatin-like phospholipase family protein [Gemmatimonadaceae bacterium]|nr:patatin-like phospholipase family protein [Gemmatimonadaceae bacterium]